MYLLLDGISTTDNFRVEIVTRVEFVPTLTFDAWAPSIPSKLTTEDLAPFKKVVSSSISESVSGLLGDLVENTAMDKGTIYNMGKSVI